MDWRMLGFTAGITVLTCVLFGLTPALRATRVSPGVVLKSKRPERHERSRAVRVTARSGGFADCHVGLCS